LTTYHETPCADLARGLHERIIVLLGFDELVGAIDMIVERASLCVRRRRQKQEGEQQDWDHGLGTES
jgi:hypothetical protein